MVTKSMGKAGKALVTFSMPASIWADTICVVGDFNGWDATATPLHHTEAGWLVALELEAGQAYQYRYLVNGEEWHNDWNADRYEPNRYGGDNSVVVTPDFNAPSGEVVLPYGGERVSARNEPLQFLPRRWRQQA